MKLALALLLLLADAMPGQEPEQSIRSVLRDQTAAWNRGDIDAFMKGYEDSPRTIFVGKDVTRGYRQVLERYRQKYPSQAKMGTLTFSILEVRPLGERHAAVIGRFQLNRSAAAGGDADGIFTLLFEKTLIGWKIVLDHTS